MNIENRLKKLELQAVGPGANFCDCFEIFLENALDLVYSDQEYTDADFEKLGENLTEGNFCDKCQKPVSEKTIKLKNDLTLMYGENNEIETQS